MLQLLFLIPMFISIYYVSLRKVDKAFLNVYLPCLLFVPTYYALRLPHMPPISPASGALIPIGFSLLANPANKWHFRRMDLWVLIFMISIGLSETLCERDPKNGMLLWVEDFIEMFLAYIVGRQIIEPNLRLETVKRMTFLFVLQAPFALYEWRMGSNPWLNIGRGIFAVETGWMVQMRGGTARIATCFAHAIWAGMLFMTAIVLNYYLVQIYKLDKRRLGKWMSMLQKYRIPFLVLPVMLYMTGSRMPLACTIVCFLFLQIPRFKSVMTGVIVILAVIGIGGGIVYGAFEKYTTVEDGAEVTEAQSSAIYRKELLVNYEPILEAGGWLGYGALSFPRVKGQVSIDNNYLILQLGQGKLGRYSFILLGIEGIFTLWMCAMRFKSKESMYLAFSLMGALIGMFAALTTVSMMEQVIQMTFLLLGWSQSLQDTRAVGAQAVSTMPEPKFRFRRVIA